MDIKVAAVDGSKTGSVLVCDHCDTQTSMQVVIIMLGLLTIRVCPSHAKELASAIESAMAAFEIGDQG